MRLPRGLSGDDLAQLLERYGYAPVRQTGSHLRLVRPGSNEHRVTIPRHENLRVGTLDAILAAVAVGLGRDKADLAEELFGR